MNSNGRGSGAWSRSWTHLSVDRRSPSYWRVTFDHPPINTITATTVADVAELVGLIEQEAGTQRRRLRQHESRLLPRPLRQRSTTQAGPQHWASVPTGMHRVAGPPRAPVPSRRSSPSPRSGVEPAVLGASSSWPAIFGSPRARTRCSASSRSEPVFVPGGGPMSRRLPLGRSWPGARNPPRRRRTSTDHGPSSTATSTGSSPTTASTRRSTRSPHRGSHSFHHNTIAGTKSYVDQVTLPADSDFTAPSRLLSTCSDVPAQQEHYVRLEALGLNADSDLERRLGRRVLDALPDA